MKEVEDFLEGIAPTRDGIVRLAGALQTKGLAAESEGIEYVQLTHAEAAYMVKVMQTLSGIIGEMAEMLTHQAAEIRVSRIELPPEAEPKILRPN